MSNYKNLEEVLTQCEAVIAFDILQHALNLPEECLNTFEPPEEGLYIVGGIEPIVSSKKNYHFRSEYEQRLAIVDYKDILKRCEDVVDQEGQLVITGRNIKLRKKYLSLTPSLPVTAVKVGIAVVIKYLNSLNRLTRSQGIGYRLNRFVKPEFQHWIDNEEYDHHFEELLDEVSKFIGKDTWHIYFTRVKGTTLLIEKTIDYRIYKYYEQLFSTDEGT